MPQNFYSIYKETELVTKLEYANKISFEIEITTL